MYKDIKFDIEAREGLKRGIDKLAKAVSMTLGPQGLNMLIDNHFGHAHVTKDGVSVARQIMLKDPAENLGATLVKNVASRTDQLAGDGTTTATVLAHAIITEGLKLIAAGASPLELKRGIDKAVETIVERLEEIAITVEADGDEVKQIATVSANWDEEIGEMIAKAYAKVGKDGVIDVQPSKTAETYIDLSEGLNLDRGMISPYFATNARNTCEMEDLRVLLYDGIISKESEIVEILENCSTEPLLIVANGLEGAALGTYITNKMEAGMKLCAIRTPGYGDRRNEYLADISAVTGARVLRSSDKRAFKRLTDSDLGKASSITVTMEETTIVNNEAKDDFIDFRIQELEGQLENAENEYEKDLIKKRKAAIKGGVGVVYVGAVSELEMKEKKDRIQDALKATKAALEEGIVTGGGTALIKAFKKPEGKFTMDETSGINIIAKAIEAPLRAIVKNAGEEGSVVLDKIVQSKKKHFGFNAKTNEYVNDMLKAGIIDPKKVTRVALENAASVAGMILTTGGTLVTPDEAKDPRKGLNHF